MPSPVATRKDQMEATPPQRQPSGWRVLLGRHEQGQSLIEMAIILPVILLILAAVLDFGRVFHAYTVVVNAAREAAFAGAAEQLSDSALRAVLDAELQRGGVSGGSATSTITYANKGSPARQTLKVDLSYNVPLIFLTLTLPSVTVRAQAETITFR